MKIVTVIFTRHQLTDDQKSEMFEMERLKFENQDEMIIVDCPDLARINIQKITEALDIVRGIIDRVHKIEPSCIIDIFGVVPAPIRWALGCLCGGFCEYFDPIYIFESFNVNRSKEGEKPTFEHEEWLLTQTFNNN